jgi:hypothetical protein
MLLTRSERSQIILIRKKQATARIGLKFGKAPAPPYKTLAIAAVGWYTSLGTLTGDAKVHVADSYDG